MNKKEVSEIKKQFKLDNVKLTIGRLSTRYIDEEGNTIWENTAFFDSLPDDDRLEYMDIFKKTLGGGLGKNLLECPFDNAAYEADGIQGTLRNLISEELSNKDTIDTLFLNISEQLNLHSKHYITLVHCNYTVPSDKKHKGETDGSDDDYSEFPFIICSVCDMDRTKNGLCYDNKDKDIKKKANFDIEVQKTPLVGFMFPTFSDRTSDINAIMVFTKDKKEPNLTFIKDILQAKYDISYEEELGFFKDIVQDVCGENLEFDIGKNIYSQLNDILERNVLETEQPTIGYKDVENILVRSGVSPDVAKEAETAFENHMGDKHAQLKVINLTDENKTNIKASGVNISISAKNTDAISTKVVDGIKCIVIPLEDNSVTINDMDVQG